MNADGSGYEIVARGIRNSVGFDWDPATHHLWFTDNGRDWLGDNQPPDELNHAPFDGMHFGFPIVMAAPSPTRNTEKINHTNSRHPPLISGPMSQLWV